ncbi:B12-binding domain-containing radical SAM protein [Microseira wollei]|uniref:Hopanoid biosynthesis associated radical SAM protein HpnJ n=1 Tax=Microseira wollei NIES-4236 TaxID=2530354 RepID=A0AAV3XKZ7_9CYAN|nr:radical SAM protein [Microseira wollei]GET41309.1 hopanoid biosynthesis associated radical SAM protein HpnJ [Microseira wollei NIES-4236]
MMAKVCLVRPLLSPTEFNGYPLNLLILASSLRNDGHSIEICDYDYLKEHDEIWIRGGFAQRAAADVLVRTPDFVAITAMCSNYVLALDLAEQIKALSPKTHITFGGPHVSLCAPETLNRYTSVDTAVIGEGEVTLPALVKCVENGDDLSVVPGLAFRRNGETVVTAKRPLLPDLNLSPRPAYDLVDILSYARTAKSNYLEIYAGSGCPFRCTFCSTSIVWERKYRTMSADRIVSEMQELNSKYGVSAFNLIHDNLTSDKKFIGEIASTIKARQLHVRWGFSSRIDTIDLETIQLVAEAGCDYIFFGVESGSERIQATMKKRLKLKAIWETLELCVSHGIAPTTSFILGFPDEELEDVANTIRLAFSCKVRGARRSFINLLSSYTGTPVMQQNIEKLRFDMDSVNSTMVSFLEEKHFDVIKSDPFIFANYYSLDYTYSALTAKDYLGLVDFYTICLFRYTFVISFLINEAGVNPILLFRDFEDRLTRLSVSQRNNLDLEISHSDICPYLTNDNKLFAYSLLSFDHALRIVSLSEMHRVLYSGTVCLLSERADSRLAESETVRDYLLYANGDIVNWIELSREHSLLYEVQGLPAIRAELLMQRYKVSA